MTEWVTGKVIQVKYWTERLFSLIIHAPISSFIAGQFTKLGLDVEGKKIQRAYSYVNAPKNENLEFYIAAVSQGTFSTLLQTLEPDDLVMITKEAKGCFTLDAIPSCKNLWMLATGTAIGPYLSILSQEEGLERFQQIILVHAVRFSNELSYLSKMMELQQLYKQKLRIQTIVSREKNPHSLSGRIPSLILNGSLEEAVNCSLDVSSSHVMLCGNPNMVHDTQNVLQIRGMRKHLKNNYGHITSERYW